MTYQRDETPSDGLRLHLNEHTGGCPPGVVEVLRSITCEEAAWYPDYGRTISACARHFGVSEGSLVLTNGLDEGILIASVAALRGGSPDGPHEAIVLVPAFDMYATCAAGAGGRVVEVRFKPDFEFPLDQVLDAISPMTRIVFITDPHNPTGLPVRREWVLEIAQAAPDATIFLDEAYAEFSGRTLIGDPALGTTPNVLIGRTFSKAFGLAAFRAGALLGQGRVLEDVRQILPPFNLNLAAAIALPAALSDRRYYESYIANVGESKRLLYEFCDSRGLQYWPSEANFVLVRIGQRATDIVTQLRSRGIYVRDRSSDFGCAGCVRITAGIVQHTRQCIDLLGELL